MKSKTIIFKILLLIVTIAFFLPEAFADRDIELAYNSVFKVKYDSSAKYYKLDDTKWIVGFSGLNIIPVLQEKKFETIEQTGFVFDRGGYAVIPYIDSFELVTEITAEFQDKSKFEIEVIGEYPPQGIIVVRLKNYNKKSLVLGDSDNLENFDEIWTMGFQADANKVLANGIISGKTYIDTMGMEYCEFLKTDMQINPGIKCAPVLNEDNQVVGVCFDNYENIGLVEPINYLKPIIQGLKSGHQIIHSWCGLWIQEPDDLSEDEFGIKINEDLVYIASVFKGSPAETAGLKQGDIILSINDQNFSNLKDTIKFSLSQPVGTQIKFKIKRKIKTDNFEEKEFIVTTIKKPYKLRLNPLDELLFYFGMKIVEKDDMPYIDHILKDSPAIKSNLKEGKCIKYILPINRIPKKAIGEEDKEFPNRVKLKRIRTIKTLEDHIINSVFDNAAVYYIGTANFLDQSELFVYYLLPYLSVI